MARFPKFGAFQCDSLFWLPIGKTQEADIKWVWNLGCLREEPSRRPRISEIDENGFDP